MKADQTDKGYYRNAFDEQEPQAGHENRFMDKVDRELGHNSNQGNKSWLRIAAGIIILIGAASFFYFLNPTDEVKPQTADNKEVIPIDEASQYYQHSYDQQFKAIASNYTDEDSKNMIAKSEKLINTLEEEYVELEKELTITGDPRVATAMILNYKSRIGILEQLVQKLEYVTQQKLNTNEKDNV